MKMEDDIMTRMTTSKKMEEDLKKKWKTTSKKMEDNLKQKMEDNLKKNKKNKMEEEPIKQNQPNWL
jgi:hypothetical protein